MRCLRPMTAFGFLLCLVYSVGMSAVIRPIIPVPVDVPSVDLRHHLTLLPDFSQSLTLEQVLDSPDRFRTWGDLAAEFGEDGTDLRDSWVIFTLENTSGQPMVRELLIQDWVEKISIWSVGPRSVLLGQKDYFDGGVFPSPLTPFPHFSIQLQPGQNTFAVKLTGVTTVLRDFSVYQPEVFETKILRENFSYALMMGVIFIMGAYNLILYFSFRNPEGGYFSAYIWLLFIFFFTRDRVFESWFVLEQFPSWLVGSAFSGVFFGFSFAFQALYGAKMLGLGRKNFIQIGLLALPAIGVIVGAFIVHFNYGLGAAIGNNVAALFVLTLLGLAIFHSLRGEVRAMWLVASVVPAIAGGLMEMMIIQKGLVIIYNPWQTGICLEIVILSAFLGYRITSLRKEKQKADRLLLDHTLKQAEVLEATVAQQTQDLRVANATKDKFFSIVAHDLRGPIGSLSVLFNEVIQDDGHVDPEILSTIRRSTKNTHSFLEELLTWARSQKGEIDFRPRGLDVRELCEEAKNVFSVLANSKGIQFETDVSEGLWAFGDHSMVSTILRNLCNNATKFTDEGGKIRVFAEQTGEWVKVFVSDEGVGMPEGKLQSLFRLDVKAESSPGTRSESGTGLGLILCQEFVSKNGGEIGVESVEGQGSTFWFTLPAAKQPDSEDRERLHKTIQSMKVLVAEDNALHLKTTSKALETLGIRFDIAHDGIEALDKLEANRYDLLLVDIDMPKLNGVDLCRSLQTSGETSLLKIALSSYTRADLGEIAGGVSFEGYLNKPLVKDELVDILEALLIREG